MRGRATTQPQKGQEEPDPGYQDTMLRQEVCERGGGGRAPWSHHRENRRANKTKEADGIRVRHVCKCARTVCVCMRCECVVCV